MYSVVWCVLQVLVMKILLYFVYAVLTNSLLLVYAFFFYNYTGTISLLPTTKPGMPSMPLTDVSMQKCLMEKMEMEITV